LNSISTAVLRSLLFKKNYLTKDQQTLHQYKKILTEIFARTCEISQERGNRTLKPKR